MAIGTITKQAVESGIAAGPIFFDHLTFLGDDDYPTGGTLGFDALVQAVVGDARDIIAVIALDCGGLLPVYVRGASGTGTLKVYAPDYADTNFGPMVEAAAASDFQAVTFNVLVISK